MNSKEKEIRLYYRNAVVAIVCVAVAVFYDVQKFVRTGHLNMDWKFFVSILLYILLIVVAIIEIKKAKKAKKEAQ